MASPLATQPLSGSEQENMAISALLRDKSPQAISVMIILGIWETIGRKRSCFGLSEGNSQCRSNSGGNMGAPGNLCSEKGWVGQLNFSSAARTSWKAHIEALNTSCTGKYREKESLQELQGGWHSWNSETHFYWVIFEVYSWNDQDLGG